MKASDVVQKLKTIIKHPIFVKALIVLGVIAVVTITAIIIVHIVGDDTPERKCLVTFDSRGGSSVSAINVNVNSHISAPETPTKDGFAFDGWHLNGRRWDFENDIVTESIVLQATWCDGAKIVFDTGVRKHELCLPIGRPIDENSIPYVVDGGFLGWYSGCKKWDFSAPVPGDMTLVAARSCEIECSGLEDGAFSFKKQLEVFSEIADDIGVTLVRASDTADIELVMSPSGEYVDLSKYLDYMPALARFLGENPSLCASLTSASGEIYGIPAYASSSSLGELPFLRSEWIELLLDGDEPFSSGSSSNARGLSYTPVMPTEGVMQLKLPLAEGDLKKNYSTAGNIISVMNSSATAVQLSGEQLVNMFREYIDKAYNGYYGAKRSELFLGENAAFDPDELVALLRCVVTNGSYLTRSSSVRGVFVDDIRSLVSFAALLFGDDGTVMDVEHLAMRGKSLIDTRENAKESILLTKINELLNEGLITLDPEEKELAFAYYADALDARLLSLETHTVTAPPIVRTTVSGDHGSSIDVGVRKTTEYVITSPLLIAIPQYLLYESYDSFLASLRLIDYMFDKSGRATLTAAPSEYMSGDYTFGSDIPTPTDTLMSEIYQGGVELNSYLKERFGSCLLASRVSPLGYFMASENNRSALNNILSLN